jgi:hypothetical protein
MKAAKAMQILIKGGGVGMDPCEIEAASHHSGETR